MKAMKVWMRRVLVSIHMFNVIFLPNLLTVSMSYIVFIINICIILFNYQAENRLIISKASKLFLKLYLPILIYISITQLYHIVIDSTNTDIYVSQYFNFFFSIIKLFINCLAFTAILSKSSQPIHEFNNYIIVAGILQLICVISALVFPDVRQLFISTIQNYGHAEYFRDLANNTMLTMVHRGYGLSSNLYDSFGYVTSIIIITCFIRGISSIRYLILSILMMLMPLVNARSGIVLTVVSLVAAPLFTVDWKRILKTMLYISIAFLLFNYLLQLLPTEMNKWILEGTTDINELLTGSAFGNDSIFKRLFIDDVCFPNNILIGAGASPNELLNLHIDNGYIRCIWNFGIVGTIILLTAYLSIFRSAFVTLTSSQSRCRVICLAVIFIIYLFKLYSIQNDGGNFLIIGAILIEVIFHEVDLPFSTSSNESLIRQPLIKSL